MKVNFKKLHKDARTPEYAHHDDAGMDLFSIEDKEIKSHERVQIKTGLAFEVPEGFVGLVWDKSGLSHRHGLKTLGGVLDSGYRGELLIGLANISNETYEIKKGDKIAQMLIQKIERPEMIEVDKLTDTERGEGGFGSTGK